MAVTPHPVVEGVGGLLTFGVGADCAAGAWLCVGVDGRLVPSEGSVPPLCVAQVALSEGDVCVVDPVTGRAWRACGVGCWCSACVEAMGGRAEAERVRVVCRELEVRGSVAEAAEGCGVGVSKSATPSPCVPR